MPSHLWDSIGKLFRSKKPSESKSRPGKVLSSESGLVFTVEQVKRGGIGVVHLCRLESNDTRALRIALKTFDEKFFFDPVMADMFAREHEIWSLVADAPFVFPLIGVHEIDKKPYLAMPVAEPGPDGAVTVGESIRAHPEGLPVEQCLQIALCLALAMKTAAECVPDVVHGDIKPDNLLFLGGWPFLSDFGLAGIANRAGRRGTPPYMAPELWTEEGRQTVATDIYAYGATVAELLTGRTPLEAPDVGHARWQQHATVHPPILASAPQSEFDVRAALSSVALRCLAKQPEVRPTSFAALFNELLELAFVAAPGVAWSVIEKAMGLATVTRNGRNQMLPMRLEGLLRADRVDAAVQLVERLAENEITGELLLRVGTVWSFAGDDEKALRYFDRYLDTNPDAKSVSRCLNEKSLSLRRLGRLDGAEKLFDQLLVRAVGDPELETMVRTNYAAVLYEKKDLARAREQLQLVLRKDPKSLASRALHAQVLAEGGELQEAVEMIQSAIGLDPRNGLFHVQRAEILLNLRRVEEALESLDRAYSLGFTSRSWLKLTLAANIALKRNADAAALFQMAEQNLPKSELEELSKHLVETLRAIAPDGREPDGPKLADAAARSNGSSAEPAVPSPQSSSSAAEEADSQRNADEYRRGIRTGKTAHTQIRMSYVDGSFTIDFYLRLKARTYFEHFREAYASAKAKIEPMSGLVGERQNRYRFVRCQHCGFTLLSARDEGEHFLCQACGERGPVVTERDDRLDALARECERAIGRREREVSGESSTLIVGFWHKDEQTDAAIAKRMAESGYTPAPGDAFVFLEMYDGLRLRDSAIQGPPAQVWHRPLSRDDVGNEGETPSSVDRLLRDLRREHGALSSSSMDVSAQQARLLLATGTERLEMLRELARNHPDDPDIKQILVSAELQAGNLEEASRIAAALELAFADHAAALYAAAEVAVHRGQPADALARLEKLLTREPRNQSARMLLVRAYQGLGKPDKAAEQIRAFEAIGGVFPRGKRESG